MPTATFPFALPPGAAGKAGDAPLPAASTWLWRLAAGLLAMAGLTALGLLLDDRQLGYGSVWTKPLKFQLALAVHAATFAWALTYLTPALRRVALPPALLAGWSAVVLFEAIYITLQGARGAASHFNRATPWESVAATGMAVGAGVLVSVTFWIGVVALWQVARGTTPGRQDAAGSRGAGTPGRPQRRDAPAGVLMPLAIGLGFTLGAVLAAWSGGAMGAAQGYWPQPLQEPVTRLPLTGWVLSQPDLRIAHFIGLHQMQILPALAAVTAWAGWRRSAALAALAGTAGLAVVAVGWLLQR